MSRHRVTLLIDVDDEALVEHVTEHGGMQPPYTTLVSEWDASDIFRAAERGIVDPGECVMDSYDGAIDD